VDVHKAVEEAARAARATVADLAGVPDAHLDHALRAMADHLRRHAAEVLEANAADLAAARADGLQDALLDRLRLDDARLSAIAGQLRALADVPAEPSRHPIRDLPGGLRLEECRRPVGVIGANFEARPNVVVDIASQFVKSRNAGVLRTGSAAIRSAVSLADQVIAPALAAAQLDPAMIQLVRVPGQDSARALVSQPGLIPLVILRGSGDSTRSLAAEAARRAHHGPRRRRRRPVPGRGRRRLDGLLADRGQPGPARRVQPPQPAPRPPLPLGLAGTPGRRGAGPAGHRRVAAAARPPAGPRVGPDAGHEATVTIAAADGPRAAAVLANTETSGLAAAIVTTDTKAAAEFLGAYAGTGAFWNATTRLLDGFKLFSVPETGINIDAVPGPRGPVTFRDLYLRQLVVTPS
jgi:glutamate-5-semialdehyde dehydrogenase